MQNESSLEYFAAVERSRYEQQRWMHDYFDFGGFRGKRVLEIGVGHGTDLLQFARGGAQCHAIDITDRHLELAARNFALRGLTADLRRCDATAICFPDGYFDCVYSFGVLHHVPEIERCIAEAYRVLKPGGTFYLSLYHTWSKDAFSLVVGQGLLRGKLLWLGYRGLLSTIELGADGVNEKPYVKLYSRGEMRRLLRAFRVDDVAVHQINVARLPRPIAKVIEAFDGVFGWYVTGKVVKT